MYKARAYGVDANASCGIVESRAFGEPEHAMLGSLTCSALGTGHQPSARAYTINHAADAT
jgi:hypothetical protein